MGVFLSKCICCQPSCNNKVFYESNNTTTNNKRRTGRSTTCSTQTAITIGHLAFAWPNAMLRRCFRVTPAPSLSITAATSSTHVKCSVSNNATDSITLPLSVEQHGLLLRYWRDVLAVRQRDVFKRTMLFCIGASPKLNEIIARGDYCYRDLSRWPKLNAICESQYRFFERLICEWALDGDGGAARIAAESRRVGAIHAEYALFGAKPHFYDIFQQQFIGLIERGCDETHELSAAEKRQIVAGFIALTTLVIDAMNAGQCQRFGELLPLRESGAAK